VLRPIGRLASVASQLPPGAGQPVLVGATFSDIDRLQLAFETLQTSLGRHEVQLSQREATLEQTVSEMARTHERLGMALHGSKQSIWEWRVADDAFVVDERWSQIVGRPDGPIDFKGCVHRVYPADRRLHRPLLEDCLNGQQDHFRAEYRIRKEGRDWFWVETNAEVVERDAQGRAVRIIGTLGDISQRKQHELELEQAQGQLLGLVARVDAAVERERQRLTRELHDELGQLLTGIQLDIAWLDTEVARAAPVKGADRLRPDLLRGKLEGMTQLTSHAMAVVHDINSGVRLPLQDGASLADEMTALVERFGRRTGLRCTTSIEADSGLDRHQATSVFRVCQESLTNIARHAGASCVSVVLGRRRDEFVLEVRDDGCGLADPLAAVLRGGGLTGMRERAMLLGGMLTIDSQLARGTTIRLAFPCTSVGDRPGVEA
jgi:two-component system, NarL family, sensor histidine kinase UhpB